MAEYIGTDGDDVITGTPEDDVIDGGPGNDILDGKSGNNLLYGGEGDDTLFGGSDNDFLNGGPGNDYLEGGLGDDDFQQDAGNDTVIGGSGFDTLDYWTIQFPSGIRVNLSNNDLELGGIHVGPGTALKPNNNIDVISDIEQVLGSNFDDFIVGNDADNWLIGGAGEDYLDGQGGTDTVNYNSDIYWDRERSVIVNLSSAEILADGQTIPANSAIDPFGDLDTLFGIEVILGSDYDDFLVGGDASDILFGNGGNDLIDGGEGSDSLRPGPGNDTVDGGGGENDELEYRGEEFTVERGILANLSNSPQDLDGTLVDANTVIDPDGGIDSVSDIDVLVSTEFDDVIIGGDQQTNVYANAGDDRIILGPGGGWVRSGPGNDFLDAQVAGGVFFPGDGDDTVIGSGTGLGVALTTVAYTSDQHASPSPVLINLTDTPAELNGTLVAANIASDPGGGIDSLTDVHWVVGTDFDDFILASAKDDVIWGGQGNDFIDGGDGQDDVVYNGLVHSNPDGAILANLTDSPRTLNGTSVPPNTVIDPDGGIDTVLNIEIVSGTGNNDFIFLGPDAHWVRGADGDDFFDASASTDRVTFQPGTGSDTIIAGPGLGALWYDEATLEFGVRVNLSTVTVTLGGIAVEPGTANDSLGGVDQLVNIVGVQGTPYDDYIVGNELDNDLAGGDGSDYLDGQEGSDLVNYDDPGLDGDGVVVNLSDEDISVDGLTVPPNSAIDPYGNSDTLLNIENLLATHKSDFIVASGSDNWIDANDGDDTVAGGAGNDGITGGKGDDKLFGDSGDDWLYGGEGNDTVDGGEGFDFYALSGESLGGYEITENEDGSITVVDINTEDGDDGTDTLVNIEAIGLAIQGTDGDDVIFFDGEEAILAIGGDGDDRYILKNEADYVLELPDEGTDIVEAGVNRTLEPNVENLMLTGDGDVNGTGNGLRNEIDGNAGDNILDGRAGADVLRGGAGSDTYYVDNRGDSVIETESTVLLGVAASRRRGDGPADDFQDQDVADDIDQVFATISYALTDFVENLTLDGSADIDGTGNGLDNVVVGNPGANVLSTGSGGDDTLSGGTGDDTYLIEKTTGTTRITDNAAEANLLDLSIFVGSGSADELEFSQVENSNTLRIANTDGGIVDIGNFFADDGVTVQYIDFGAGAIGMHELTSAEEVGAAALEGEATQIIDADGNLYDAKLRTPEGETVSAAEAQLFRTYSGALGRTPDQEGYEWWLNQIAIGNHDLRSMASGFIFSEEFIGFFGAPDGNSVDNADFVNHMYLNVFGREPDQGGFDYWLSELVSGNRNQTDVLVEMTQSNEYVEQTVNAVVDYLVG